MNYSVVLTRSFKRSVKRLEKRFRHVKNDVRIAIQVLLQSPRLGVVVPGTSGMRKLRVRNTDLPKGKREMKTLSDRLLTRGAVGSGGVDKPMPGILSGGTNHEHKSGRTDCG